jgi:hypothetical protein
VNRFLICYVAHCKYRYAAARIPARAENWIHRVPQMGRRGVAQLSAGRVSALFLAVSLFLLPSLTAGQTVPKRSLITQSIDESNMILLKGNTYPLARAEFDRGAAPLSLPMQRMLLVLKRSPELETALGMLLDQQQDKASPNFHQWLTPEQFGQQFGPSDEDVQTVTGWLQSQGFQVAKVSKGRTVIEFSGTAEQVQGAFRTAIHEYMVDGVEHWANASDPQIPSALAPVVAGPLTLHNFPRQPMYHAAGVFTRSRSTGEVKPVNSLFTFSGCGNNCFALGPFDFATIYNVLPLWNASPAIDGTGQSIAIVAESDIDIRDAQSFRSLFGLPPNDPQIIHDGPDPGIVRGAETESDLDVEWSGAVARNATIQLVISASTDSTLGVDLAAQYITDNNLAPIMSVSYGICEAGLGTAGNLFFNQLWQQASAQGITVLVATGDSGSATCDRFQSLIPQPAQFGLQVSGFASTPFNVAVGGTDFNDVLNATTFWNTSNDPHQTSAKGYIPEITWNNSCASTLLAQLHFTGTPEANCNNPNLLNTVFPVGGSGGMSRCTSGSGHDVTSCSGGYAKPSWQTGLGVPADGKRDIPDVSLFASDGFYTSNFYVICSADLTNHIYCDPNNPSADVFGVGGTSASAPSFAGIMALVNQKTQSRQGNANYVLYKLAAQAGANCPSVANPASSCVFYDVTSGTIAMPCVVGSPNCTVSRSGDQFGVLSGYSATAGYDLATGLGSVNASNLVAAWSSAASSYKSSTTTLGLTPSPVSITHGTAVNVNISVSAMPPATGTPTGLVSLIARTGQGFADFTLNSSGSVSATTGLLPGGNQYTVTAHYPGDGVFGVSDSSPVTVTVNPEASTSTLKVLSANQSGQPIPFTSGPYGSFVFLRADVVGQSGNGTATGQVNFADTVGGVTTNVPGGPYGLNGGGNTATPQGIFTFVPGQHTVTASYGGDASFNPSTSSAQAFTITAASTSVTVGAGSGVPNTGAPVTLISDFTATSCGNLPTGGITFFAGSTSLGTGPLALAQNSNTCSITGSAFLDTSALPVGVSTITAKYNGDSNYASSTSTSVTLDVVIPTTISLTSSNPTIQQGQSVTFTAIITPSQSGGPPITGSVRITSPGGTSCTSQVSNAQAQCTTSTLNPGPAEVDAIYLGDSNYEISNTSFIETVIPGPDFSVVANPQTINITSPGSTGSTLLTFGGVNGFTGAINLSAASCSGLPAQSSCSFSPSLIQMSGTTTTGTTTLTISTMAASNVTPHFVQPPRGIGLLLVTVGMVIVWFFVVGAFPTTRRWNTALVLVALAALLTIASCGGGGGGGGGTPVNPGTPVGVDPNVVVSITSGGVSHSVPLTVNVQ